MIKDKRFFIIIGLIVFSLVFVLTMFLVRSNNLEDTPSSKVQVIVVNRLTCAECDDYFYNAYRIHQDYADNSNVEVIYYNVDRSGADFNAYTAVLAAKDEGLFWGYLDQLYRIDRPISDFDLVSLAEAFDINVEEFNNLRDSVLKSEENNQQILEAERYSFDLQNIILINEENVSNLNYEELIDKIDSYLQDG